MTLLGEVKIAIEALGQVVYVGSAARRTAGEGATLPAMPYTVLDPPVEDEPDWDTGSTLAVEPTIRVHVFDPDFDTVKSRLDAIEARFLDAALAVQGISVGDCTRGSREQFLDPDLSEEGEEVWHGVMDLSWFVDREPGT